MIYSSFKRRVAAAVIDGVIIGAVTGVLTSPFEHSPDSTLKALAGVAAGAFTFLYGVILESSSKQATVGKMFLGIKVTDMEGNRISFLRSLGRHCCKFFSLIILGIGFLFPLFTRKKQALHDMIAGCLVLKSDSKATA